MHAKANSLLLNQASFSAFFFETGFPAQADLKLPEDGFELLIL